MGSGIKNVSDKIDNYKIDILRGLETIIQNTESFLLQSTKILNISDPKRQLALGFSIVKSNGKIIKSVKNVKKGDELDVMLSDGVIKSITQ
jgi:exonuclease VII large subunit